MPEDSNEAPELRYIDVKEIEDKGNKKWDEMSDEDKLERLKDI